MLRRDIAGKVERVARGAAGELRAGVAEVDDHRAAGVNFGADEGGAFVESIIVGGKVTSFQCRPILPAAAISSPQSVPVPMGLRHMR